MKVYCIYLLKTFILSNAVTNTLDIKRYYFDALSMIFTVKSIVYSILFFTSYNFRFLLLFFSSTMYLAFFFVIRNWFVLSFVCLSCCSSEKCARIRLVFRRTKACYSGNDGNYYITMNECINRIEEEGRERERKKEERKRRIIVWVVRSKVVKLILWVHTRIYKFFYPQLRLFIYFDMFADITVMIWNVLFDFNLLCIEV